MDALTCGRSNALGWIEAARVRFPRRFRSRVAVRRAGATANDNASRRSAITRPQSGDPQYNSVKAFLRGLHELGYIEGQNITVQQEFAEWKADRLRELAAKLVDAKVDVIE